MFDLNEKKNQFFFTAFGLQVVPIPLKKKLKTNYCANKINGKSWVSL